MPGLTRIDWNTIVRRVREGKLTPIISDSVSGQLLPGYDDFAQAWAAYIDYPLGDEVELTRLARYLSVSAREVLAAKEEFLAYSSEHLLDSVKSQQTGAQIPQDIAGKLSSMRYSELAARLGHFKFDDAAQDPLYALARLDLPIFITTSCFNFLERALLAVGKKPRIEICYWRDNLKAAPQVASRPNPLQTLVDVITRHFSEEEIQALCFELEVDYEDLRGDSKSAKARELVAYLDRHNRLPDLRALVGEKRPNVSLADGLEDEDGGSAAGSTSNRAISVFDRDPDYAPSVSEPLIYHLHGLDIYPASLVLTEDDYLDFLVKVSWDKEVVPYSVREGLENSTLLLLGYELQDWDFRVLFRGLISPRRGTRRRLSVSIQFKPESDREAIQVYREKYFDEVKFKVYWGKPGEFMGELWSHLDRSP
jgi:hypothetical protein